MAVPSQKDTSIWSWKFPQPHACISLYSPPLVKVQIQFLFLNTPVHYLVVSTPTSLTALPLPLVAFLSRVSIGINKLRNRFLNLGI